AASAALGEAHRSAAAARRRARAAARAARAAWRRSLPAAPRGTRTRRPLRKTAAAAARWRAVTRASLAAWAPGFWRWLSGCSELGGVRAARDGPLGPRRRRRHLPLRRPSRGRSGHGTAESTSRRRTNGGVYSDRHGQRRAHVHVGLRRRTNQRTEHEPHGHPRLRRDRKSTRLNSRHVKISYAVF